MSECCDRRGWHKSCQHSTPRLKTDSGSWRSHWNCFRSSCFLQRLIAWDPSQWVRCKGSKGSQSGRCYQDRTWVELDCFVCRRRWVAISITHQLGSHVACLRLWFAKTSVLQPFRPRSGRSWKASRRSSTWQRRAVARTVKYSSFPKETLTTFASCRGGKISALICTERAPSSVLHWQFQHIHSPVNYSKMVRKSFTRPWVCLTYIHVCLERVADGAFDRSVFVDFTRLADMLSRYRCPLFSQAHHWSGIH